MSDYDEFAGAPCTVSLDCGATGHLDGCGYRCDECMAIWGSMACACSDDLRRQEVKEKAAQKPRKTP